MRIEYVAPFLDSAVSILEQIAGQHAKRGSLGVRDSTAPKFEVAAILGIVGQVRGQVVYAMSLDTAKKLASSMMGGFPIESFDEMSKSAISELGNMITGNASTLLEANGIRCEISPPTLVVGKEMEISSVKIQTLVVPINMEAGLLEIAVGLMEA